MKTMHEYHASLSPQNKTGTIAFKLENRKMEFSISVKL